MLHGNLMEEKQTFQQMILEHMGIHMQKQMNLNLNFIPYAKTQLAMS